MTDIEEVGRLSARSLLEKFRSALDSEGEDVAIKRRSFLSAMLASAGLAATDSVMLSTSAEASTIERNANTGGALMELDQTLYRVGRDHMRPGQDADELMSLALGAWRDACMIRHSHLSVKHLDNAMRAEATAAGLIGSFYGDRGERETAERWYRAGLKVAPDDDTRALLYGWKAWLYLYADNPTRAKTTAHKAVGFAPFFRRDRAAFAYHQLARGFALEGQFDRAREHLSSATNEFLFSSASQTASDDPSLLTWTTLQHSLYSADTLAALAFNSGRNEDISRFAVNAQLASDTSAAMNGMNAFIIGTAQARVLASGPEPDVEGAVEVTMNSVGRLRNVDKATTVVKMRTKRLADELEVRFGDTNAVRGLHGFAQELAAAA